MKQSAIRMILSDVDGTLLEKGCSSVSDDVFDAISSAVKSGMEFVIASGRSYQSLKHLFSAAEHLVTFVACDGTIAVKNGETLYLNPVSKPEASVFLKETLYDEGEGLMICVKDRAYSFGRAALPFSTEPISSGSDIAGEINKLSFYGLSSFKKEKIRALATRYTNLSVVYDKDDWFELIPSSADKGIVCTYLQKIRNISPLDTAAFGDNDNDFGMLRCARLSFSAPNAIADIKKMCKFQAKNIPNEIRKLAQERGTL